MAPYPDSVPTETSPPAVVATAPAEDSALPGMKRGIAIGVACSVGIIMLALLAFFAYRRRKQREAKHTKVSSEEPVEMDAGSWPQEKTRHVRAIPIEADAQTIHELDGSEVPELPGHYEGQELNANKKTPRASYGDENDEYSQKLKQWNNWSIAPEADHPQPAQEPPRYSNPTLAVSYSTPQQTNISPLGGTMLDAPSQNASFSCVSPIALSPLEDTHLTPTRDGEARRQRYYDHRRT